MKAHQRKRQRFLGGSKPFGYRLGDDGGEDQVEQQAIARMRELRRSGMALRRVAEVVSAESGRNVSHMLVKRRCQSA